MGKKQNGREAIYLSDIMPLYILLLVNGLISLLIGDIACTSTTACMEIFIKVARMTSAISFLNTAIVFLAFIPNTAANRYGDKVYVSRYSKLLDIVLLANALIAFLMTVFGYTFATTYMEIFVKVARVASVISTLNIFVLSLIFSSFKATNRCCKKVYLEVKGDGIILRNQAKSKELTTEEAKQLYSALATKPADAWNEIIDASLRAENEK